MADTTITKQMYTDLSFNGNVLSNAVLKNITITAADGSFDKNGAIIFDNSNNVKTTFSLDDKSVQYGASASVNLPYIKLDQNKYVPFVLMNLENVADTDETNDASEQILVFDGTELLKSTTKLNQKIDFNDITLSTIANDSTTTDDAEKPITLKFYDKDNTEVTGTNIISSARSVKLEINTLTSKATMNQVTWAVDNKIPTADAVWTLVDNKISGVSGLTANACLVKNNANIDTGTTDYDTDNNSTIDAKDEYNRVVLLQALKFDATLTDNKLHNITIPAGTVVDINYTQEVTLDDSKKTTETIYPFFLPELNGTKLIIQVYKNSDKEPFTSNGITKIDKNGSTYWNISDSASGAATTWKDFAPVVDAVHNDYPIALGIKIKDETAGSEVIHVEGCVKQSDKVVVYAREANSGYVVNKNYFSIEKTAADVVDLSSNQSISGKKTFDEISIDLSNGKNSITNAVVNSVDEDNGKGKNIFAENVIIGNELPKTDIVDSTDSATVSNYISNEKDYDNTKASASKLITELALAKALEAYTGNNTDIEYHDQITTDASDLVKVSTTDEENNTGYAVYKLELKTKNLFCDDENNPTWGTSQGKGKWLVLKYAEIDKVFDGNGDEVVFNQTYETAWDGFDSVANLGISKLASISTNISDDKSPLIYTIKFKVPTTDIAAFTKGTSTNKSSFTFIVHGFKTLAKFDYTA